MAKQKKTAVKNFLLIPYNDETFLGNEEQVLEEIKEFMACGNHIDGMRVYAACDNELVEYAVTQEIKLVKN